jgi:predicted metal-dependent hydrolase
MSTQPISMTVRRPRFDHTDALRNWMPNNPEFGYRLNGGSLTLPHLEPYLIRVMRQARSVLEERHPEREDLMREIDLFNAQEAQHFQLHRRYNDLLHERYEGLEALEEELAADFARFLREESLEWNLGYSAGFETTGMVTAELFFREAQPGMVDADPRVHDLWAWHLAEEFEHRCVAFDAFRALGGRYPQRLSLFFYQARHLNDFGSRAAALMQTQDEAAGRLAITPEQTRRLRPLGRRMARATRARVLFALMPWHDPRRREPLREAEHFLQALGAS